MGNAPPGPKDSHFPMNASRFQLLPQDARAPQDAIVVDGRLPGGALELGHWPGNQTPPEFAADTATAIAMLFAKGGFAEAWDTGPIVNTHFDTDGLLATVTLLAPREAIKREQVMTSAAVAGDFDEWPEDERGLKLHAAIETLAAREDTEADAYRALIPRVFDLIDRLDDHDALWGDAWRKLIDGRNAVQDGRVEVSTLGHLGLIRHRAGVDEVPGPVISRLLLPRAWRYLTVFLEDGGLAHYRYELPRYAWADTIIRPAFARPDPEKILNALGSSWTTAGLPGLTSIVATREPVDLDPNEVLAGILPHDAEAATALSIT